MLTVQVSRQQDRTAKIFFCEAASLRSSFEHWCPTRLRVQHCTCCCANPTKLARRSLFPDSCSYEMLVILPVLCCGRIMLWILLETEVGDAESGRSRIVAFVSSVCVSPNPRNLNSQGAKREKDARWCKCVVCVKSCHLVRYHDICAAISPFQWLVGTHEHLTMPPFVSCSSSIQC